jgi:Uma2 family endonuclease
MSALTAIAETPPDRRQLAEKWRALCADPTFEDLAAKIELTEWGEIMMSPVSKTHGLTAARVGEALRHALGGHVMMEVGVVTDIGVRAPDVAWCSDDYLAAHPEEAPLSAAPELCVEIFSTSNALPKIRDKAAAYIRAGAREAWIVFPAFRSVEIHASDGRRPASQYAVEFSRFF